MKKLIAEFIGTLWLVIGGCGSAVLAAQVLGGIAGAGILFVIASGKPGFEVGGFAAYGYGDHSPGGYNLMAALVSEIVMTFLFLIIILGSTHSKAPKGFAGIAIGLGLTLIHLISIPVTNTSVNPARSTSQALFAGDWVLIKENASEAIINNNDVPNENNDAVINTTAEGIVNNLLPMVMNSLSKKTNDPDDNSFTMQGILGSLAGGNASDLGGLLGNVSKFF